jgi:hypothetical protein
MRFGVLYVLAILVFFTLPIYAAIEFPVSVRYGEEGAVVSIAGKSGTVDAEGNASICCLPYQRDTDFEYTVTKPGFRTITGTKRYVTQTSIGINAQMIESCTYSDRPRYHYGNDPGPQPADADRDGLNEECDCDDADSRNTVNRFVGNCPVTPTPSEPEDTVTAPPQESEDSLTTPTQQNESVCNAYKQELVDRSRTGEVLTQAEYYCLYSARPCCPPEETEKPAQENSPGLNKPTPVEDEWESTANPSSCKNFGIAPENFDLRYDREQLFEQFRSALQARAEQGRIHTASELYNDFDAVFLEELGEHLFAGSSKFNYTGKEKELGQAIVNAAAQKGRPVTPIEVMEECLQLHDNRMFDALLTCHNFLREDGYRARDQAFQEGRLGVIQNRLDAAQTQEDRERLQHEKENKEQEIQETSNVYAHLQRIRKSDNVGAWYHLFGTLVFSFASNGNKFGRFFGIAPGFAAVFGEHGIYKPIIKEQEVDRLEYCWDVWGVRLGTQLFGWVQGNDAREQFAEEARENRNSLRAIIYRNTGAIQRGFGAGRLY